LYIYGLKATVERMYELFLRATQKSCRISSKGLLLQCGASGENSWFININ